MKHNIARTTLLIISVATLYISLVPALRADDGCSNASVAGDWGYTYTGTLISSTGPVPAAATGRFTLDADGNLRGTQTRTVGGQAAEETLKGKGTVGSDCKGKVKVKVYDSGQFVRSAELALVYVNNSTQVRALFKSLTLKDGTNVPVVITIDGNKLTF
jgi:hypothetical protein